MLINTLRANPTQWSNKFKQSVGKLPTTCLSVFDHFVILAVTILTPLVLLSLLSLRIYKQYFLRYSPNAHDLAVFGIILPKTQRINAISTNFLLYWRFASQNNEKYRKLERTRAVNGNLNIYLIISWIKSKKQNSIFQKTIQGYYGELMTTYKAQVNFHQGVWNRNQSYNLSIL